MSKLNLFERRLCRRLTRRGWAVLGAVLLGCGILFAYGANRFLAVSSPVPADVLVVESWLPDYALVGAAEEFKRGGYQRVITCGGPLVPAGSLTRYATGAEFAAAKLAELGLPARVIVPVPYQAVARDRTYASALALKGWLQASNASVRAVNVFSLAAHARRSRFLFQKALGTGVKVGVFAFPDAYYDPDRWWASSEGVRTVLGETIAYLYARCIFPFLPMKGNGAAPLDQRDTSSQTDQLLGDRQCLSCSNKRIKHEYSV